MVDRNGNQTKNTQSPSLRIQMTENAGHGSFLRVQLQISQENDERVYPINDVAVSTMHASPSPDRCRIAHSRSTCCRVLASLQCMQSAVLLRPHLNIL